MRPLSHEAGASVGGAEGDPEWLHFEDVAAGTAERPRGHLGRLSPRGGAEGAVGPPASVAGEPQRTGGLQPDATRPGGAAKGSELWAKGG